MSPTGQTNTFLLSHLEAERLNRPKNVHLVHRSEVSRAKSQGAIIRKAFFDEIFR